MVQEIINSSSKYVNYAELEKILLSKDYEKLRSSSDLNTFIDKERIFSDIRRNQSMLSSLIKEHKNIRLDVVSLAEARETIALASTSSVFDERLQN
jgi:hypothetical protein